MEVAGAARGALERLAEARRPTTVVANPGGYISVAAGANSEVDAGLRREPRVALLVAG